MALPPNAGKGRPLGSRNKRTLEFMATLERENFNPALALIECYREAKKTYDNYGTIYDAICDARTARNDATGQCAAPTEDNAHKYLKIAADVAKDLAGYAFPKLKSIEQRKSDPLANMTAEQKLEAMKAAVTALELQVRQDGRDSPSGSS